MISEKATVYVELGRERYDSQDTRKPVHINDLNGLLEFGDDPRIQR